MGWGKLSLVNDMGMTFSLPDDFAEAVEATLQAWEREDNLALGAGVALHMAGEGAAGLAHHRQQPPARVCRGTPCARGLQAPRNARGPLRQEETAQ